MNKKVRVGLIVLFCIALLAALLLLNYKTKPNDFSTTASIAASSEFTEATEIEWDEISKDGVDEALYLKNLDMKLLEKIAANLQSAVDEEAKEEQENPEIVLTEGWTRIFNKKQYKAVVDMGKLAMKPLYWILYKSENNGQYEYLCAMALQKISKITFEDEETGAMGWETAKEYLDLFTKEIIKQSDQR